MPETITIQNIKTILTQPAGSRLIVVKIITSEPGLYGIGCATFTQRFRAVHTAIEEHLKPFLIGRDVDRIEETWQRFKDDGLMIVGVTKNSRGQTTEKVREYIGENGLTLPMGIDSTGGTSKSYSVSGIPAAALIDKTGKVVVRDHPTRITDEVIKQYL